MVLARISRYKHIAMAVAFIVIAIAAYFSPKYYCDETKLMNTARVQHDKQNFRKALSLYKRAAKMGSSAAKNNIGVMYLNGYGVDKNYAMALKCFEEAAADNIIEANHNLGSMYATGRGVKHDYNKAYEYFKKSADGGYFLSKMVIDTFYKQDDKTKSELALWITHIYH